jgi:DNA-binding NarL/FixJ family response regulator
MKCLLLDEQALLRNALALFIQAQHPQIEISEAGRLAPALALLAAQPDTALVLLDLHLPDSRGLATLHAVRQACAAQLVVMCADEHPDTVLLAREAGAGAVLSKRADLSVLSSVLHAVCTGQALLQAPSQAPSAANWAAPSDDACLGLTARQLDVFSLLMAGKANKVIARELDLSESTVKTHIQAIFERLKVSTRSQAVRVATLRGWALPPSAPTA